MYYIYYIYIYVYIYYTYLYVYILGPIRQAGWMVWVGGAFIRQALGNSMTHQIFPQVGLPWGSYLEEER